MSFDLIGDIHGHADALVALLRRLGYRERHGAWRQPGRQVIFVGDFIDRGPRQLETVAIARAMVDAGSALAVVGNHEFNAIAWSLPDPAHPGEYLRAHHTPPRGERHRRQHQAFLDALRGPDQHRELIEWFLTLPLWLELPGLRVVHACWRARAIDWLRPLLTPEARLTEALMEPACRPPADPAALHDDSLSLFKAVEVLLKGIEVPLPPPHTFTDKDGHVRHWTRTRWWDTEARSYPGAALLPDAVRAGLPDLPLPDHGQPGHDTDTPVFFGHYWLTGTPAPLTPTAACLDYSVALGGKLVAYRWDGEPALTADRFCWVEP